MNSSILLQTPSLTGGTSMWSNIFLILIIIVIFYFFLIRPQMKRNKDQQKFREGLQKGQRVVTIGGLHGKISEIQDGTVIIEIEGGVKMKFDKSAIASSINDQLNPESK